MDGDVDQARAVWDNGMTMNDTLALVLSIASLVVGCGPRGASGPEPRAGVAESTSPPTPAAPSAPPPSRAAASSASPTFVRFLLVGDEAGCPVQANGDCHSSAELLANRTLRLDAWGDPGGGVREAAVPEEAFSTAVRRLTAPEVVRLLSAGPPCPDANATESMTLRVGSAEHAARTGACNDAPIMDARGAMIELCSQLFPEHSLVSPPF